MTPVGGTVNDLGVAPMLFAGGFGGLLYWISIYPIDVIKSTMQSDDIHRHKRKYGVSL